MFEYSTVFGIDSHARTTTICALDAASGEYACRTFRGNDYAEMREWMGGFPKPAFGVYESGCTGFVPARELSAGGIEVAPIATSKMPSSADSRSKKNDREDALRLARLFLAGELKVVWVPPAGAEGLRDLSQAPGDLPESLKAARNRVEGLLCRHGFVWSERNGAGRLKARWTEGFREWLRGIDLGDAGSQAAYESALAQVRMLEESRRALLAEAEARASASTLAPAIAALACLKGVGFLTALAFAAEVGDFGRFPSGRKVAAYFGLCPSERSSAGAQRLGPVTRNGSALVRRLLTEGAWTAARTSPLAFKKRPPAVPVEIWGHALECSRRLAERRRYLLDRGLGACKANTATAAEMARMMLFIGKAAQGAA